MCTTEPINKNVFFFSLSFLLGIAESVASKNSDFCSCLATCKISCSKNLDRANEIRVKKATRNPNKVICQQ